MPGTCIGVKCARRGFLCCCPVHCSGYLCWDSAIREGLAEGALVLEYGCAQGCMLARHCCNLALAHPQLREMLLLHVLRMDTCLPVLLVPPGLVNGLILSIPRHLLVHHSTLLPCMAAGETCSCSTPPSRATGIDKASLALVPSGQ